MRILAFILLSLPFVVGCNSHQVNAKKNTALIDKYVESVENLEFGMMETLLDDDYIGYGPSHGDQVGKADAVEGWKKNVEELYESIKYNKSRSTAVTVTTGDNQGDWVSNWAELNIVYKDGGNVTIWANTIYQIENDKIVQSYTFYNEADALRQLGYVFINPDNFN